MNMPMGSIIHSKCYGSKTTMSEEPEFEEGNSIDLFCSLIDLSFFFKKNHQLYKSMSESEMLIQR